MWKLDFSNIDRVSADELALLRVETDKAKDTAMAIRKATVA
jgi:hypothetical protein